ncbi:RNA polymerase sigma factor [Ktedonosporobacter rubrisoli]|uniref:RNA polymerase sigma factor n=1 Tax=Ktedonosporobacter rubrisoli TaxID=2509675 RepID=A0A4P6JMM5_KTERU|nr:RNA polymerase sigma factor [Ktedonosporobacter rubrisoli]QBD76393.1 RNA polymerase sigma factor [Ktedonosporobacter rubrisoli]
MPDQISAGFPLAEQSDEELLAQAQAGELAAMHSLFERYHARIYRYLVYMVGDAGTGAELTRETFLKAWDALLELRKAAIFAAWLYRIATNLVRIYQRSLTDVQKRWGDVEQVIASGEGEAELEKSLFRALNQVELSYRASLLLDLLEAYEPRQIAECLGTSPQRAASNISKGLQALQDLLPDAGQAALRARIQALAVPDLVVSSPFSASIDELESRARVPFLPDYLSYTHRLRAPWPRRKLYLCLSLALLCLVYMSSGLLLWLKPHSLPNSQQALVSPTLNSAKPFNAHGQRPGCMFNGPLTAYQERGTYLCFHHLYCDVEQTQSFHGYGLTIEQAYLDTNLLLVATRLLTPDGRSIAHSIVADIASSQIAFDQDGLDITRDRMLDVQRNAFISLTALPLRLRVSPNSLSMAQSVTLQLQIKALMVNDKNDWLLVQAETNQSIVFQLSLPYFAGRILTRNLEGKPAPDDIALKQVVVTPARTVIWLQGTKQDERLIHTGDLAQLSIAQRKYEVRSLTWARNKYQVSALNFEYPLYDAQGTWNLKIYGTGTEGKYQDKKFEKSFAVLHNTSA